MSAGVRVTGKMHHAISKEFTWTHLSVILVSKGMRSDARDGAPDLINYKQRQELQAQIKGQMIGD